MAQLLGRPDPRWTVAPLRSNGEGEGVEVFDGVVIAVKHGLAPLQHEVVEVRLRRRRGDQEGFCAGASPALGCCACGAQPGGVVINGNPETFDSGQHRKAPNSASREHGPYRRGIELGHSPHAQGRFDALANAEAGRHLLVGRELDRAAADRPEGEPVLAVKPHLLAVEVQRGPVDASRRIRADVPDQADHS